MMPKMLERLTIWASGFRERCGRNARVECTTPHLGGDALQSRLIAIRQRQVAAARRELERQRPADTTGGAGHGSRCSTDRSHLMSTPCREENSICLRKASDLPGNPIALWNAGSPGQAGDDG